MIGFFLDAVAVIDNPIKPQPLGPGVPLIPVIVCYNIVHPEQFLIPAKGESDYGFDPGWVGTWRTRVNFSTEDFRFKHHRFIKGQVIKELGLPHEWIVIDPPGDIYQDREHHTEPTSYRTHKVLCALRSSPSTVKGLPLTTSKVTGEVDEEFCQRNKGQIDQGKNNHQLYLEKRAARVLCSRLSLFCFIETSVVA